MYRHHHFQTFPQLASQAFVAASSERVIFSFLLANKVFKSWRLLCIAAETRTHTDTFTHWLLNNSTMTVFTGSVHYVRQVKTAN